MTKMIGQNTPGRKDFVAAPEGSSDCSQEEVGHTSIYQEVQFELNETSRRGQADPSNRPDMHTTAASAGRESDGEACSIADSGPVPRKGL